MVAEQNAAAEMLKQRVPGTLIMWHPVISSPRLILNQNGFLSGTDSEEEMRPRTLAEAEAVNPNEPRDSNHRIRQFLDENAALFGHSSEILSAARISREYVTAHNGLRTVVWEQQLDGIPVFEAVLYGHIGKNGELVNLSSQFLPALAAAADAGVPERQRIAGEPVDFRAAGRSPGGSEYWRNTERGRSGIGRFSEWNCEVAETPSRSVEG
jgi:hypothetical protein